ncbi:MAG: DUF2262 domain-containing protein [Defluviitaleaceae bacterium]|nr:DUF2262 domain-containing protein [Defluviitaleaceae bacterium]
MTSLFFDDLKLGKFAYNEEDGYFEGIIIHKGKTITIDMPLFDGESIHDASKVYAEIWKRIHNRLDEFVQESSLYVARELLEYANFVLSEKCEDPALFVPLNENEFAELIPLCGISIEDADGELMLWFEDDNMFGEYVGIEISVVCWGKIDSDKFSFCNAHTMS